MQQRRGEQGERRGNGAVREECSARAASCVFAAAWLASRLVVVSDCRGSFFCGLVAAQPGPAAAAAVRCAIKEPQTLRACECWAWLHALCVL